MGSHSWALQAGVELGVAGSCKPYLSLLSSAACCHTSVVVMLC